MSLDTVNALITVANFKSYIGQDTGSTSNDSRYEDIINNVSWRFNSITNRLLKARSITEYRDGNGTQEVYTDQWPINSNSTSIDIRIDTDRDYDTGDKVDSDSIVIYSTPGRIHLEDDTFSTGPQAVKLVYNGGYSTIPYDLAYAAKEMCRLLWKKEQENRVGIKSQSYEGGSVTYEQDLPWSVRKILDLYKSRDDFK
jgi:hypothetical protein